MATKKKRLAGRTVKKRASRKGAAAKRAAPKKAIPRRRGAQQGAKALVRSEHLRARPFDGKRTKLTKRDTS